MKKQNIFYLLLVLAISACGDDDKLTLTHINPIVIESLPTENLILEELALEDPLLFTVRWSEAMFHLDGSGNATPIAPITYNVEIDHLGLGFATAKTLSATSADTIDVMVNDLNTFLVKEFEINPGATVEFELRVTAKYGEGQGNTTYSSNVQILTITPYAAKELGPLQGVYIVGDMNGWDTKNKDFRIFRNNSADQRVYIYTGRLDGYFKFVPEEALGSWKLYHVEADGVLAYGENEGGAFYVDNKYVTITLDLDNMTWAMEDFDEAAAPKFTNICFVGNFCNWGEGGSDPEMTQSAYDPHIWELKEVLVELAGYGVKFRDSHGWDNRWCPSNPNDIPYGKGRRNPTDDPNIAIQHEGNYYVKFNDLTGHYIVEPK